jgi:hypothetical protein
VRLRPHHLLDQPRDASVPSSTPTAGGGTAQASTQSTAPTGGAGRPLPRPSRRSRPGGRVPGRPRPSPPGHQPESALAQGSTQSTTLTAGAGTDHGSDAVNDRDERGRTYAGSSQSTLANRRSWNRTGIAPVNCRRNHRPRRNHAGWRRWNDNWRHGCRPNDDCAGSSACDNRTRSRDPGNASRGARGAD